MRLATVVALGFVLALLAPLGIMTLIVLIDEPPEPDDCVPSGSNAALAPGSGAWTIPIGESYRVSGEYGWRTHPVRGGRDLHTGIDLSSPSRRAPILAASAGKVKSVTDLGPISYGRFLVLDHGGGVETLYAHLATSTVKTGDTVATGQRIGIEGGTGGVTGVHLHFEVRQDGHPVDTRPAMRRHGLEFDGRKGTAVGENVTARLDTAALSSPAASTPEARGRLQVAHVLPRPFGTDRSRELSPEQWANARALVDEARRLGIPPRGWAIVLITALQEANLHKDLSADENNDAGILQQRVIPRDGSYYGTIEQVNDPAQAARWFFRGKEFNGYHIPGLLDIQNWQALDPWQAAARVQRPAKQFEIYYRKHEATAAAILAAIDLDLPPGSAAIPECDPSPAAVGAGLSGSAAGERVVNAALSQVGTAYSWGGGGPRGPTRGTCCSPAGYSGATTVGFDCSALTQYAWQQGAGIALPRTDQEQRRQTTPVPREQIQAGDLLFFGDHVGIADGKGGMIHAPREGKTIAVVPDVLTNSYYGPIFKGAGRPAGNASSAPGVPAHISLGR